MLRFDYSRRGIARGWVSVLLLAVAAFSAAPRALFRTAVPAHPVPARVLLVVAAEPIRAAEALAPGHPKMRLESFQSGNAPRDAITDPEELRNRYALRPIAAGEVIRRKDVGERECGLGSFLLRPGEEATTLRFAWLPGSAACDSDGWVDLFANRRRRPSVPRLLHRHLRLLQLGAEVPETCSSERYATVAATPRQITRIARAAERSTRPFLLRPAGH